MEIKLTVAADEDAEFVELVERVTTHDPRE
jgi:hypothetical protein